MSERATGWPEVGDWRPGSIRCATQQMCRCGHSLADHAVYPTPNRPRHCNRCDCDGFRRKPGEPKD